MTLAPNNMRARVLNVGRKHSTIIPQGTYRAEKIYKLRRAQGIPSTLVPAAPIQAHLTYLLDAGFTINAIAAGAGVGITTAQQINDGQFATVNIVQANRIMGVTHKPIPDQSGTRVPALGVHRRIRALHAIGWTNGHIGARIDTTGDAVCRYLHQPRRVFYETWAEIRDAYDAMSEYPGPSTIGTKRARTRGYAPPAAWDGLDMDDPRIEPDFGAVESGHVDEVLVARMIAGTNTGPIGTAEREAIIAHAIQQHWTPPRLAKALGGVDRKTADRAMVRARKEHCEAAA